VEKSEQSSQKGIKQKTKTGDGGIHRADRKKKNF
jgi:hypothetical protein